MLQRVLWLGFLFALIPGALRAQCPDGTPPPCRSAPRSIVRPAVSLDPNVWVVVPFDNVTGAADLDWLRDASVGLLYVDLTAWTDVRAVDDKRVADFVRELPSVRSGGRKLSLGDAQAVARRAGAGKLVMGQFLKLGARTQVSVTAYDARTGTSLKVVREETPGAAADSILPVFERIARKLLGVTGERAGAVGTTRADAYQEYSAGSAALNRFAVAEAKQRLTRAIELDSTFALAHYKLAIAALYDEATQNQLTATRLASFDAMAVLNGIELNDPAIAAHAADAARLGRALPPRERGLVNGLLAHTRRDYSRACELYGELVRADSADVEALYGVGRCSYSDNLIEFERGDSSQPRFRSSWNTSLKVLRRAIAVDPGFHLAFERIFQVLNASARVGCRPQSGSVTCDSLALRYVATVKRSGDTLLTVPVRSTIQEALLAQSGGVQSEARRQNLEEARATAVEWVALGPTEGQAHRALGRVLLRLGRAEEADRELAQAAALLPRDDYSDLTFSRIEAALKLGRGAAVNRMHDSMVAVQKSEAIALGAGLMFGPMLGRLVGNDSALSRAFRRGPNAAVTPILVRIFTSYSRIALGIESDSMVARERGMLTMLRVQTTCRDACLTLAQPNFILGLRLPRTSWPAIDTSGNGRDPKLRPARALAAGDTAQLRAAVRALDSLIAARLTLLLPEDGSSPLAADAYLILGDTLAALRVTRRMLDSTLMVTSLDSPLLQIGVVFPGALWPRGMLVRADLAKAKGYSDEAQLWYRRLLELWAKPDEELRPVVERVRKLVQ